MAGNLERFSRGERIGMGDFWRLWKGRKPCLRRSRTWSSSWNSTIDKNEVNWIRSFIPSKFAVKNPTIKKTVKIGKKSDMYIVIVYTSDGDNKPGVFNIHVKKSLQETKDGKTKSEEKLLNSQKEVWFQGRILNTTKNTTCTQGKRVSGRSNYYLKLMFIAQTSDYRERTTIMPKRKFYWLIFNKLKTQLIWIPYIMRTSHYRFSKNFIFILFYDIIPNKSSVVEINIEC